MEKSTPASIAREFGVSQGSVFKAMEDMHLGVKRMGAQLNSSQEKRLRAHFAGTARATRRQRVSWEKQMATRSVQVLPQASAQGKSNSKMESKMNESYKTCTCCSRRWALKTVKESTERLCPECRGHYEQSDETIERRLQRAETHARLYWQDRQDAREFARKSVDEKKTAYDKRTKWMRALIQVVLDHDEGEDGLCWCGQPYPCRTWKKLEEANRGIHRDVEKYASWDDKRLQDFLWGEGRYQGAGLG